jgi:D-amino-acid dehydrogenase
MNNASAPVVIVGGGVIGTACAYYLSQKGVPVTIVEKASFAGACSQGNCGYICPSHVLPLAAPGALTSTLKTLLHRNSPLKLRLGFLFRNLGWFLKFARKCNTSDMLQAGVGIQAILNDSRTLYDQLVSEEQIPCEWDTHGLLFIYQTQAAFEHYAEINQLLTERFNTPAQRYDAEALLQLEPALKPGSVSGAYLYKSDVQVRPDLLMKGWRKVLEQRGVTIREQCEFRGLITTQNQVTAVNTSQGEVPASAVVFATGAWTPLLNEHLGCRVPIIPGKGYSLTMPRPTICPTYPMIFEEHRVAISPFQSGYRIGSTMEFAGYDTTINPKRLDLLRAGAQLYLREPLSEPVQNEWFGWRPMVYDGLPIIDRSPKWGNAFIAAGHGMLGLSMATGTGKLIRELVINETPHIDPKPYSQKRFG